MWKFEAAEFSSCSDFTDRFGMKKETKIPGNCLKAFDYVYKLLTEPELKKPPVVERNDFNSWA